MEHDGYDGSWRQALNQHMGLLAPVRAQALVALLCEALMVLEEVQTGRADHLL